MQDELPNPGVYVDFVVDIQNVTDKVFAGTRELTEDEAREVIRTNIKNITNDWKLEDYQTLEVVPMFAGNKYYAFVIETYHDIRLVGAPPQSIGKFGSDTDNWVWPRHTGDFSLFRIYADKNNRPANYSPDNVPFKPKYFLSISIKQLKEGDFTFVYGFPGTTQEYLPATAIEQILNIINPAKIEMRNITLKVLNEKMHTDNLTRIKYAAKYAAIANSWKKWIGESKGLETSEALTKKRAYEQELSKKNVAIGKTLDEFEKMYKKQDPFAHGNALYSELMRNSETFYLANQYLNFVNAIANGKADGKYISLLINRLSEIYKNYDSELDAKVTAKILSIYAKKMPSDFLPDNFRQYADESYNLKAVENWTKNSIIIGQKKIFGTSVGQDINLVFENPEKLLKILKKDPLLQFFLQIKTVYLEKCNENYYDIQQKINILQKKYMAQQMQTDKERIFFPDANSTLRIAYGQINGSTPADAIQYEFQTTLDGLMEKYIPDDYEFDVPQKLIELYKSKNYGKYANADGRLPIAFTATNHTTGGNSGSPVLDENGNLIGLNFDRQWEGTMSDINFDPRYCRNIMVSTKYILFIIDKFANAQRLLDEITVVE
jgi:hypothetical protein